MTPKRFKSKIDRRLLNLLLAVTVFEVVVISSTVTQAPRPLEVTFLIVAAIAIVALPGSMLIGAHYTMEGNTMRIRYGSRHILVSPAGKADFPKAIGQEPADARQ